jgi:hypothetical protein
MDLANKIELFGTCPNAELDRRFRGGNAIHGRPLALSSDIL